MKAILRQLLPFFPYSDYHSQPTNDINIPRDEGLRLLQDLPMLFLDNTYDPEVPSMIDVNVNVVCASILWLTSAYGSAWARDSIVSKAHP